MSMRRPELVYRPTFGDVEEVNLTHPEAAIAVDDLDRVELAILGALLEDTLEHVERAVARKRGR